MAYLFLVLVIHRLTVNLDKTIEFYHLTLGNELLIATTDINVDSGLFYLGVSHLAGNGALPYQVVELALLGSTLYLRTLHIGRTDGFVSLLGTFRAGVILAYLAVFLTIQLGNLFLAGIDTQGGEVYRVCTHIGNLSVFVQVLSHHHGLAYRKA